MKKTCIKCKKEKSISCFNKWKRGWGPRTYCRQCQKIANKKWKERNKEKIKIYNKNYNNLWVGSDGYKKYWRDYDRKRRKNPKFRVDDNMSSVIRYCLKGKKAWRKWRDLVGYKAQDLINHLEKQFDDKINWDNYGSYWEIDHIKPKSLFKYETAEDPEFKKCWALENLQPLEKIKNRSKHDSYVI